MELSGLSPNIAELFTIQIRVAACVPAAPGAALDRGDTVATALGGGSPQVFEVKPLLLRSPAGGRHKKKPNLAGPLS